MLKIPKQSQQQEINDLINEEDCPYLSFSPYKVMEHIKVDEDEWNKIARISVNKDGDILGYFSFDVSQVHRRLHKGYFVKFRKNYKSVEDKNIVDNDSKEFIDDMIYHPIYNKVEFASITVNPANKTFENWMEQYDGVRYLFTNYIMLPDGKFYDIWDYYFDRGN